MGGRPAPSKSGATQSVSKPSWTTAARMSAARGSSRKATEKTGAPLATAALTSDPALAGTFVEIAER